MLIMLHICNMPYVLHNAMKYVPKYSQLFHKLFVKVTHEYFCKMTLA